MRYWTTFLLTCLLFTGCGDAAPTGTDRAADGAQPPVEYVWVDTLISSSHHGEHWQSANLLESSKTPDQGGLRDGVFEFRASLHPQYGGYGDMLGGWFWNYAVCVCAYDSVVVSGVCTQVLFNAESCVRMEYAVGRSGFCGLTIAHTTSEPDTIVTPFAFGVTPDSHFWMCGSMLRIFFFSKIRPDLISGEPGDEYGKTVTRLSDVEIRGYRKIPVDETY